LSSSASADVIVIGAGIHGCAAAFFLARHGMSVLVLERDRIAQHASSRSAGGVRQLGRDMAEVPLAAAAMELWYDLRRILGDDGGFRTSGQVRVAENDEDLSVLAARAGAMREQGYMHEELLDRAALRDLLPAIAAHCVGGLLSRRDGFANPYRTTLAFARAARALGSTILEGAPVTGIERIGDLWVVGTRRGDTFRASRLLNAAGAWGSRIAAALGDKAPLGYAPFMMSMTSCLSHFVGPVVIGTGRPLSFKQLDNGAVMIGGGYVGEGTLDQGEAHVNVERLSYNVRTAKELFPILAEASIARSWCGLEGVFPDHIPVIGPGAAPNCYHAFGFCGHGFQLAPAVGSLVAELIATGASNLPIGPFRIGRFNDASPAARSAAAG
jgi:sarcosine oxidase, subunit beta